MDAQQSKDLVAAKARAWLTQQVPCSEDVPPGLSIAVETVQLSLGLRYAVCSLWAVWEGQGFVSWACELRPCRASLRTSLDQALVKLKHTFRLRGCEGKNKAPDKLNPEAFVGSCCSSVACFVGQPSLLKKVLACWVGSCATMWCFS